jgi:hypothetical protein
LRQDRLKDAFRSVEAGLIIVLGLLSYPFHNFLRVHLSLLLGLKSFEFQVSSFEFRVFRRKGSSPQGKKCSTAALGGSFLLVPKLPLGNADGSVAPASAVWMMLYVVEFLKSTIQLGNLKKRDWG